MYSHLRRATIRAAALLLAGVAACSDTPTGTPATAADQPPALNSAPQPTATNSGGYPLISWSAIPGAVSYKVGYAVISVSFTPDGLENYNWDVYSQLGTTTGTSWLDTTQGYTGDPQCYITNPDGSGVIFTYQYVVTAVFANGTSTGYISAPIAPC